MKRRTIVILDTPGYSKRIGSVNSPAVGYRDGTKQYRVTLRGTFMTLTFREDEFHEASTEELQVIQNDPNIRILP